MQKRVIVDENAGPGTAIWEQFQQVFGGERCEYVFLARVFSSFPSSGLGTPIPKALLR